MWTLFHPVECPLLFAVGQAQDQTPETVSILHRSFREQVLSIHFIS
jgi:hypothetical protein